MTTTLVSSAVRSALGNLCAGSWFHSGEAVTADFFRFKPNVVEKCGLLLVLLVS
jgi:hypothetical protein